MATVYLIPSFLAPMATETILPYVMDAVKHCQVFFVENERTARRFLKAVDSSVIIDDYEWITIPKNEEEISKIFLDKIKDGKNIGIISEAGCPGVADPGQKLVAIAQKNDIAVKPLVGPNSILLALMASGLNGQSFEFVGYLPIENNLRNKRIRELEQDSMINGSTKIFIETPYRNKALVKDLLSTCKPETRLCIAFHLTSPEEFVKTKPIKEWKNSPPELDKQPAIFLIQT